jgi:hypothetical protein
MKRVVGNIGNAGMALLIPPAAPRTRAKTYDWRSTLHAEYNLRRENNFEATSLHLSFTGYSMPLNSGIHGLIDHDMTFLEALISVRDRGDWVADLNVLDAISAVAHVECPCSCSQPGRYVANTFTSIDNWDELLDPPGGHNIVRARDNWVARLAAACIAVQDDPDRSVLVVNPNVVCMRCLLEEQASSNKAEANLILID